MLKLDADYKYRRHLFALVAAMFSMAMGVGFIVPLLPVYADQLGASGTWIGLIFGANPFLRAAFMIVFGSLADYRGKKKIMAGGLLGYLFVSLGFIWAASVLHLFYLRILQGVFSSMISPVARAYAGEISPPNREGSVMGILNTGFFAGFAGGPIIGGLFADHFGFTVPFYAMGILCGIAFALVIVFVPEQTAEDTATEIPQKRPSPMKLIVDSVKLLQNELVRGMVLIRSSVGVGHGIFSALLPLFAQVYLGVSSAQVGFAITTRALVGALLQKKGGTLADTLDRKKLAIFSSLLAPAGFLLVPHSQNFIQLLAVSVLIGVSFGISVPAAEAMAVEFGRSHNMGQIMGVKEMCRSLAMGIGSVTGGVALDLLGPVGAHVTAALASSVGLFIAFWNLRDYQKFRKRQQADLAADD